MDDKTISTLVIVAVLLTAGVGLYIAFVAGAPGAGKTIEGAEEYYSAHRPYEYGAGFYSAGLFDLAKKLREQPRKELPVSEVWEGFCVLMFNPRSASIIPVPVGRHRAMSVGDSAAVEMMESRGWIVVDVMQKKGDNICPSPKELPTLIDIMDQYGL